MLYSILTSRDFADSANVPLTAACVAWFGLNYGLHAFEEACLIAVEDKVKPNIVDKKTILLTPPTFVKSLWTVLPLAAGSKRKSRTCRATASQSLLRLVLDFRAICVQSLQRSTKLLFNSSEQTAFPIFQRTSLKSCMHTERNAVLKYRCPELPVVSKPREFPVVGNVSLTVAEFQHE